MANRTSEEVEARVLAVRARLAENPWAQVGAEAIAWELEKLGGPVPPVRTIEEILARAGADTVGARESQADLQGHCPTRRRRPSDRGTSFRPTWSGRVTWTAGCVSTRSPRSTWLPITPGSRSSHDRGDQRVLGALYALWERHGLPRRLQLDNGGPFVSPTGLGEVVRVCLHQRVTLVFIPPREPWRNGTIEHFNNTFQQALLPPRALRAACLI